ncbi:MAG: tRNA uridine-5-carboxymethylaminomethyl(34) synthesis GTPase MnmE [Rikenellaceae bacterium]
MYSETIIALATGINGAIATLRMSGKESISIAQNMFNGRSPLKKEKGFTLHFGDIIDKDGNTIDQVLLSLFRSPSSYTGEDMVEISCHASTFIVHEIIKRALELGARSADAGEFTLRAYTNGKMDIVQAEGVADLIASTSAAGHRLAINQMRGGYSKEFVALRAKLLHFMSMIELELDFSDEDVEFADRTQLRNLLLEIKIKIETLISSFNSGNAIKSGVPVAIVGKPNVGKSTLLNRLLGEERAIVSEIAGTTRDTIEDTKTIGGVMFRFIDTAGIRQSIDTIELIGIERTFEKLQKASVVLLLIDTLSDLEKSISSLNLAPHQKLIILLNKYDLNPIPLIHSDIPLFAISAKQNIGISELETYLSSLFNTKEDEVIITNTRHWELLTLSLDGINRALEGLLNNIPTDFISQDIQESLHHLGSLTGEITSEAILHNIFASFCIGK